MTKKQKSLSNYYLKMIGKKGDEKKSIPKKNRFSGQYEKYQESSNSKPFKFGVQ